VQKEKKWGVPPGKGGKPAALTIFWGKFLFGPWKEKISQKNKMSWKWWPKRKRIMARKYYLEPKVKGGKEEKEQKPLTDE